MYEDAFYSCEPRMTSLERRDWTGQDFRSHVVRGSRREGGARRKGRGNGKSTAAWREVACCILMEEGPLS